jgi:hypothetical protein
VPQFPVESGFGLLAGDNGPEIAVALCSPAHHHGITLLQELQRLQDAAFLLEGSFGLFCHGPQFPERFFGVADELAIEADGAITDNG